MPFGLARLPDARKGSGYVTLHRGPEDGPPKANASWPYRDDDEYADELSDDMGDELEFVSKKIPKKRSIDHLAQLNYRPHSFVGGSTRGLTGIMASVEPRGIIEALAGAIGQASPSYNVMSADATTRTRPGRKIGSKRGFFSAPPPKPTDPFLPAADLEDIAMNQIDPSLQKQRINHAKVTGKKNKRIKKEAVLRAYVSIVLKSSI